MSSISLYSITSTRMRSLMAGARGRVLKNALALSIAQLAGYILPLFLLPYTAVILGPVNFGILAIIQALNIQCVIVVNYGFPFSATRQVALAKQDHAELASILVNVWAAKFLLTLACLLVSLAACTLIPPLRPYLIAYLCGFLALLGVVFFPDWFFQGVEEMKWITFNSVLPKLVLLPLIFVFVKRPDDYWKLLLILSMNSVASGVMGIVLVHRWLGCRFPMPRPGLVATQLRSGFVTFLSCAAQNLNASLNTLILGALGGSAVVGFYSAAQKVVNAVLQISWMAVSQALYPFFCHKFHVNFKGAAQRLRQIIFIIAAVTFAGALAASLFAPTLVRACLGVKYASTIPIFQVLIFLVCAASISSLLGMQGLLGLGLERDYLRILATGALLNIALSWLSIKAFGAIGLALAVVFLELITAGREFRILRHREVFS
jgi:PST family polysaccharide transporter